LNTATQKTTKIGGRIRFDRWDRRNLIETGLLVISTGIGFSIAFNQWLGPLIKENVFNGLLVAISIFIAYVSVVIIFYPGKVDEFEKEYLAAVNNYFIGQREVLKFIRQIYEKFSNAEHKTMIEEAAIEQYKTAMEGLEKNRLTKQDRDEDLDRCFDGFVRRLSEWVFFLWQCI
jgi:hypothetical protein